MRQPVRQGDNEEIRLLNLIQIKINSDYLFRTIRIVTPYRAMLNCFENTGIVLPDGRASLQL